MRVTIAAVGRDRSGPTRGLFDDYCRRCPWPVSLVEVPPRTAAPLERRLAEEAERLSSAVSRDAVLISPRRERPQPDQPRVGEQDRRLAGTGPRRASVSDRRPRRPRSGSDPERRSGAGARAHDLAAPSRARAPRRAVVPCRHDSHRAIPIIASSNRWDRLHWRRRPRQARRLTARPARSRCPARWSPARR